MTLKEKKQTMEANVKTAISASVNQTISVATNYDMDKSEMIVSLIEPHYAKDDRLEGVVHYGVRYNEEQKTLNIYAISRTYSYDNLGVSSVVNNPIFVDEGFYSSMKQMIEYGMSDQFDASVFEKKDEGKDEGKDEQADSADETTPSVVED